MGILTRINSFPSQTIDLESNEANANSFLYKAQYIGKQIGYSKDKIDSIISQMKSGDYKNLLEVFMEHFSNIYSLTLPYPYAVKYFGKHNPLYEFEETDFDDEEDYDDEDNSDSDSDSSTDY